MSDPTTELHRIDPVLAPVLERVALPPHTSTQNVFHDLIGCLVEQQIHYRSTKRVFQKLLERANLTELTLALWPQFEERALPTVRLSMSKVETLGRVVAHFRENKVDWAALSDADVRQQWKPVKGIGSWTVDMILLYTLERPDVFPAEDYGLRQIMDRLYDWHAEASLSAQRKAVGRAWSPHASTAVRYLLAYRDQLKNKTL